MSKIAYFLGGMLAGAATLAAVSWLVSRLDDDAVPCTANDDGCLKDEDQLKSEGAAASASGSASQAAEPESGQEDGAGACGDGQAADAPASEVPQPA